MSQILWFYTHCLKVTQKSLILQHCEFNYLNFSRLNTAVLSIFQCDGPKWRWKFTWDIFCWFLNTVFDEHYKMTLVVIDTFKKNSGKVHLKILFRFLNILVRFYCLHICLIICAKSNEIFSAVIFSSNSGTCTNTALPDIICKLLQ